MSRVSESGLTSERVLKYKDDLHAVGFSPSGDLLAFGGDQKKVRVLDPQSDEPGGEYQFRSRVWDIAFHPTLPVLGVGLKGNAVVFLDYEDPQQLAKLSVLEYDNDVNAVAFSSDGGWLICGDDDGYVHRAKLSADGVPSSGATHDRCKLSKRWIKSVDCHPFEPLAVAAGRGRRVWLLSLDDGLRIRGNLDRGDTIEVVRFTPCGRFVVIGDDDGRISVWDWSAGEVVHSFLNSKSDQYVYDLAFNSDGTLLATASHDERLRVWRPLT